MKVANTEQNIYVRSLETIFPPQQFAGLTISPPLKIIERDNEKVHQVCNIPLTLRALAALFLIAVSSASVMRRKYRSISFCKSVRSSGDAPGRLWDVRVLDKMEKRRTWGREYTPALVST